MQNPAKESTGCQEYLAHGYQAQQFGNPEQMTVQLKKEGTLRSIVGFNKD